MFVTSLFSNNKVIPKGSKNATTEKRTFKKTDCIINSSKLRTKLNI